MSFSGGSREVLRADYVLNYRDTGLTAATRADSALRESVSRTATTVTRAGETVDRMSVRQATAWKRAAETAARSQRAISEGQLQSSRKVDSSITRTVSMLRKQGLGYEEITKYMRSYRVSAEQTARAVETSASKEIAATDRVLAAQKRLAGYGDRLKRSVGFGSSSALHPLSSARSGIASAGSRVRSGLSGGAGLLAGGLLGFVSIQGIKSAAEGTTQLLQNATALQRFAGLSQQAAASWVAVADAYGVSTTKLGMTFKTLGAQVQTQLTKPTTTTTRIFKDLGITTEQLRAHQGNLSAELGLVADHLNKMPAGASKTTDAAHLLGRSWQTLVPILDSGSKGMSDQLAQAKALGVQLGGNSAQNVAKLHEAMINLKLAQTGMSVQFTEHILPALLKFANFGIKVYEFLRQKFAPVFHFLGGAIHAASAFLQRHTTLMTILKDVVVGAVAAFAGFKIISLTTRLFRGLFQDVKAGANAFKALASPVETVQKLFGKSASAEDQLMGTNAKLAESNAKLAGTYDALAASAGRAAEAMAAESEAGGVGAVGGLPMAGGAARTAERGISTEAATAEATAVRQYGAAGLFGAAGGRQISQAEQEAAQTAEKSAGRFAGLGSGLLRGGMIAGGGLLATQLAAPFITHLTGMSQNTGGALKGIGYGASIGAGLGSVIPGVGTLLGGLGGGAIGGLVSQIGHTGLLGQSQQTPAYVKALKAGQTVADAEQAGMKFIAEQRQSQTNLNNIQKHINTANVGTLEAMQKRLDAAKQEGVISNRQAGAAQKVLDARGAQLLQHRLGSTFQDIATSKYAPNSTQIFQRTTQDLAGLPAHLQNLGGEAMVKFAAGLEQKGKLAKGTTNQLIGDLEALYGPKLTAMLGQNGADSMQAFIDSIKQAKTIKTVQDQVNLIHKNWSAVIPQTKVTSDNLVQTVGDDMNRLKGIIATSTGKQHDEAVQAYNALRTDATNTLGHMVTTLSAQQVGLKNSIAHNSTAAKNAATTNFEKMAGNITKAVGTGVEGTGAGIVQITKALNTTLSAFGGKPIPGVAGVGVSVMQAGKSALGDIQSFISGAATGARVPGSVGPDNWMLLDPSGRPAAMVGGAELLIANRHTEKRVDGMLAYFGTSLDREVAGETRLHSAATGARIPRAALGLSGSRPNSGAGGSSGRSGYVFPFSGSGWSLGRTDQGVDFSGNAPVGAIGDAQVTYSNPNDGWYSPAPAFMVYQLRAGPDSGKNIYVAEHLANMAPAGARVRAGTAIAQMTGGIEMGWAAGPQGHQIVMPMGANHLTSAGRDFSTFLTGLAHGRIAGGAFGGSGAISIPRLKVPAVKGTGTMANIVRLGLGKLTAAANAKAQKLATAGGGGGSVGSLVPGIMSIEKRAASIAGLPFNASVVSTLLQKESAGGVNEPPSGALSATGPNQVIPGTFATYAVPGHTNINNPLDNAIASMRYIRSTYGSLAGMASATGLFTSGYHGYARGGRIGANRGARIDPPGSIQQAEKRALAALRATHAPIVYAKPTTTASGKTSNPHAQSAFRVNASSEVVGGQGAFGFSPGANTGGAGYSILSGSGLSSDPGPYGIALGPGKWKPPSPLIFRRGSRRATGTLQDIGAGDNSRPTIGLYPTTIRALGGQEGSDLSGVEIERADGKKFTALRATSVKPFALGGRVGAAVGRRIYGPPVFQREGPSFYDHANRWYGPWARPGWHRTQLAAGNEQKFRGWLSANRVPFDPNASRSDYDMRGFWYHVITKGGRWDGGHFPDTYKTPFDTTFSRQSIYAKPGTPFDWYDDSHLLDYNTGRLMFSPWGTNWHNVAGRSFARGGRLRRFQGGGYLRSRTGRTDRPHYGGPHHHYVRTDSRTGRLPVPHHPHGTATPGAYGTTSPYDYTHSPAEPFYTISTLAQILAEIPTLTSPADYGARPEHVGHQLRHRIHRTGRQIHVSLRTIADTGSPDRFRKAITNLGKEVNNVETVSYGHLVRIGGKIRKEITHTSAFEHPGEVAHLEAELKKTQKGTAQAQKLAKELKTARDSAAEEAKLQAALKVVDKAEEKRVSSLVGHAQAQAAALSGAQTRLQRMMVRRNIDAASEQGSKMLLRFDERSTAVLRNTVASLRKAEKLAERAGDDKQAAAIRAKLRTALDSLDQAVTDRMQARMDLVTNTVATITGRTSARSTALGTAQALAGALGGRYGRIVAGAAGIHGPVAAAGTEAAAKQSEAVIQGNVNALSTELLKLQKQYTAAHSAAMKKTVRDAIEQTGEALAQAAQDLQDAISGAAQAGIDKASGRESAIQVAQNLASLPGGGRAAQILSQVEGFGNVAAAGTAGAAKQSETVIQGNIDALTKQLLDLQKKYANAHTAAMKKTLKETIEQTAAAIEQQAADLKAAIEGAAQQAVDLATHMESLATTGEQHLQLQQELAGTSGTPLGATQLAAYINATIIPAIQNELKALQSQLAVAQTEGDTTLANQIGEAIASKQNDLLQEQLDAQNAIKAAAQATEQELSSLSGATGFDYQGQQFTDAIAANVGA